MKVYIHRDSKIDHWVRRHLHLCSLLHRACACTCPASQMAAPAANLKRRHCHRPNFESLCVYRKKRTLTLLEIMIVIVLIGLIGSVIGVNMKGSLDEGRAFKTQQAQEQIQDILMLEVARGTPIEEVVKMRTECLANSGLVKNPTKFLKDGWNEDFVVKVNETTHSDIIVYSQKLRAYNQKKRTKMGNAALPADPEEANE